LSFPWSPRQLTAVALMLVGGAACLGLAHWQWQRAQESRETEARFDAAAQLAPLTTPPSDTAAQSLRYRRLSVRGAFVPGRQFLLDNIVEDGRAGYDVLTPFRPLDGDRWLLVNRGWLPANPDRRVLPDIRIDASARVIAGRIDRLPRPGLDLGSGERGGDGAAAVTVLSYPTTDELGRRLGRRVYSYQLLLDAGAAGGFTRDWRAPGLSPERHLAYAGQWVLFAGGAIGGAIAILLRSRKERPS
jgi:surfeit locus 1 family protein